MFSHLCMKYIFFLLAIATIVVGIPLEETRNLALEETQNLSLSRRQADASCSDPFFPVWRSSSCRKKDVIAQKCYTRDGADYAIFDKPCEPGSSCIDFIVPEDQAPLAICINNTHIQEWNNDNDHKNEIICGKKDRLGVNADVLTFGMTTYDTNANPIQVEYLDVFVNNADLFPDHDVNHYSRIYENYTANQDFQFCFKTGSDYALVTAVAGVFGLVAPDNELTVLSLE